MSLRALDAGYDADGRSLLGRAALAATPGEVHAILGPNGAGKSTLLKLLSGELRPARGEVMLDGRPLAQWDLGALARRRAVLPQDEQLGFGFLVEEVVALGRLPCPRHPPAREEHILRQTLEAAGVAPFWGRSYTSLSGGERRRVQLARVLAQVWEPLAEGPRYLLLDEPTASLDLAHQHASLTAARRFARDGNGVAVVLHDPNLALAYADTVSLLADGAVVACGAPAQVLDAPRLRSVFGIEATVLQPAGWPHPVIATRPHPPLAGS
ncbi:heme ABC transporter ATP-binding protein [Solimonas sp. K1W22B-7]|uniref:heme ABC transporter ATP-binding protein n=1 Tax=Solimonas sp. K1W22B-7 TaxID=2303331 RepID=UPI000E32F36D|nr:heme ABC transporter ATP-binding protein [Solimonas sp. K1W22B-7]AXQ29566.1 heme ABC transporter ATP-binding protein [Solimonas sp. K1W22B-7]